MNKNPDRQLPLILHPPNQSLDIPDKKLHEAAQKFAELMVHHFKFNRQDLSNQEGSNHGKQDNARASTT
ncbi:MAG: hypothetical protein V3T17_07730 [Pseudomonadales bacterium]